MENVDFFPDQTSIGNVDFFLDQNSMGNVELIFLRPEIDGKCRIYFSWQKFDAKRQFNFVSRSESVDLKIENQKSNYFVSPKIG